MLACSRYIELNPVRAGMVARPADYRWSSYRANALGEADPLLSPHPVLLALSDAPAARCGAYRALFRGRFDGRQLDGIRSALQTGTPLGDARFRARIERRLDAKVGHDRRGRPRTRSAADSIREARDKGEKRVLTPFHWGFIFFSSEPLADEPQSDDPRRKRQGGGCRTAFRDGGGVGRFGRRRERG